MIRIPRMAAAALALAGAAAQAQPQDMTLARNLAATCANCHGTNGAARGELKPLAGVPANKLVEMVAEYRSGNQPASIMHQIAKGYTEEQIKLIATYLSAQPAKK